MTPTRSKPSRCTDPTARGARRRRHPAGAAARRRAVAEIELILSAVVLITVLVLSLGAMKIGLARLDTAHGAAFEAFHNATADPTPQYTGDADLAPIDGTASERGGLPNRTHVPRPAAEVDVYAGNKQSLPPVQVGGKAGLAGPAWTYSAYPVGGQDQDATRQWFLDYAAESHTFLDDSLRLAPAWRP